MLDFLYKIHFFELAAVVSFVFILFVIYILYFEKKFSSKKVYKEAFDKNKNVFPYLLLVVLIVNLGLTIFFQNRFSWLQISLYLVAIISGLLAVLSDKLNKYGRK